MRLSDHAKTRWRERCPDLIAEDELATLRGAGKPIIRMLNWLWDDRHRKDDKPDPGRRILVSANGVIVIACDDLVVTVMRSRQIKQWYEERRATRQRYDSSRSRVALRSS